MDSHESHGGEFCLVWWKALYGFEGAKALSKGHKDEKPAHGGIAQLVEHLLCKQGVIGSNPFTSTTEEVEGRRAKENGLIAQSVRAHA